MKANVTGHIKVTLRHNDGRSEVVVDRPNQVTFHYLDRLTELISQLVLDPPPAENAIHSIWVEHSTIGVTAPTANDEVPDANATIVFQYEFLDADIFKGLSGDIRSVTYRATIPDADAIGKTLVAAELFTRGNAGLPAGNSFTSGQNNVFMVARQLIGPIEKLGTFAVDLDWTMTFQIADS